MKPKNPTCQKFQFISLSTGKDTPGLDLKIQCNRKRKIIGYSPSYPFIPFQRFQHLDSEKGTKSRGVPTPKQTLENPLKFRNSLSPC